MEKIYEDPSVLNSIAEVKNVRDCSLSTSETLRKTCKIEKDIMENTVVVADTIYEEVDDVFSDDEEKYNVFGRPSCRYAASVSSQGTVPTLGSDSQMTSPLTDSYSEADMSSPFVEQQAFNFGMSYTPMETELESHYRVLDTPFINESNAFSCVPLDQQLDYFQIEQSLFFDSEKYTPELNCNDFPFNFTDSYQNFFMQHEQSVRYINPAMLHNN